MLGWGQQPNVNVVAFPAEGLGVGEVDQDIRAGCIPAP
jgi:hypothetical protein